MGVLKLDPGTPLTHLQNQLFSLRSNVHKFVEKNKAMQELFQERFLGPVNGKNTQS